MRQEDIQSIVDLRAFPGDTSEAKLIETHISWVILSPEFAFKIKKPIKVEFLDYSTLKQRAFFCKKEYSLNKRLAPEVYLGVLPIGIENGNYRIGAEPAVDYAVHMKRIDSSLQMDLLLDQNPFPTERLLDLAEILVRFHQKVRINEPIHYAPSSVWNDYEDLFTWEPAMHEVLGEAMAKSLREKSAELARHIPDLDERFLKRALAGFWVEGHGDLHSRNIFLSDPPIAFDCIEFSKHFRQMDVLSELAFLVMDLELRKRQDLGTLFMETYRQHWEVMPEASDAWLFTFFKAYRANVRLKIILIEWEQKHRPALKVQAAAYAQLLEFYLDELI
jgi:hypothetical protein